MKPTERTSGSDDYLAYLHRLISVRWVVIAALAGLSLLTPVLLGIALPVWPLISLFSISALFNLVSHRSYQFARVAGPRDIFRELLIDISALSALVFFTGGATNPLVSLLLLPVAIAALTLSRRCTLVIGGLAILAYSVLLVLYLPLPLNDAARATRLHLGGMWLTFAACTVMIAAFILRVTQGIRERDAALAASREQALRDEQVLALGTLAAGAAHELGTPLATMLLIGSELRRDTRLPPDLREDIDLLHQQISACKNIITQLSRRAGASRLETSPLCTVDRWLDDFLQHWHALHPNQQTRQHRLGQGKAPEILADPRLHQALGNLINNAARACAGQAEPIEITLDWNDRHIALTVRDHGPGFSPEVRQYGGQHAFAPHAQGQGIGLLLTRAAIEQLGGQLTLSNVDSADDDHGAIAQLTLPRLPQP